MRHRSDARQRSTHPADLSAEPAEPFESEGEEVREEIRKTVAALMPWGVSIMAHLALIALGFFLVWQTIEQKPEPPRAVATLVDAPPAPIEPDDQSLNELTEASSAPIFQPVVQETEPVEPTTVGFTQSAVPQNMVPSVRPGDGVNFCCGNGDEDGGPGMFELPSANRTVYIIDASGSMVDVLPFVINELHRVMALQDVKRQVTVIFFSGQGVFEVPGIAGGPNRGLRTLSPAYKQRIREWVTLENHNFPTGGVGSAHVRDALVRGLSYRPESIVLLSDNLTGGGQGATQHELFQEDLIDLIHEHNRRSSPGDGPSATISTIQFLYADPLVEAGLQGTLQRISEETGGHYRFMDQRALHLQ